MAPPQLFPPPLEVAEMSMTRRTFTLLATGLVAAVYAAPAQAQIGGLGRAPGRAAGHAHAGAGLRGGPPITTRPPPPRRGVRPPHNFTPPQAKRPPLPPPR